MLKLRLWYKPLLITSVVLGVGFGVLGISDLVILQKFGVHIAILWRGLLILVMAVLKMANINKKTKI